MPWARGDPRASRGSRGRSLYHSYAEFDIAPEENVVILPEARPTGRFLEKPSAAHGMFLRAAKSSRARR